MGDTIMKTIPFKKILILENEFWNANKGNDAYRFYDHLKADGVEFKIIERAAHVATNEEIVGSIMWCDAILFASTFLYEWDVKGVGDLLMKVPISKSVIGFVVGSHSLAHYLERIWSMEELAKMSHHKVYELENGWYDDDVLKEINMLVFKEAWDKKVAELAAYNHSFKPTGRKVRIKKILAVGGQWSLLKEGDIVDELECSELEKGTEVFDSETERYKLVGQGVVMRGVWVMGKDEPVKLLNDGGHEEWEFEEVNAENLTYEFFSRGRKLDQTDIMETVESWIYHALGKILNEEDGQTELWEWCDNLCRMIGVERRGNRHYFEKRLQEYHKKFKFFKEGRNDPKERILARQASRKKALREMKVKIVGQ